MNGLKGIRIKIKSPYEVVYNYEKEEVISVIIFNTGRNSKTYVKYNHFRERIAKFNVVIFYMYCIIAMLCTYI